jgi:hypothetical protein
MRASLLLALLAAVASAARATLGPNDCAEQGWTCPDQPPCDARHGRCDACRIPDDDLNRTCWCAPRHCETEFAYFATCPCVLLQPIVPHDEAWCEARGYACPKEDCNACMWPDAQHVQCRCINTSPYFVYLYCTCVHRWEQQRVAVT